MSYISFGMFASSITENQIIAGVLTISFFILTWFMPQFYTALSNFSLIYLFDNFPMGVITIESLVLYASFIVLFILLTILVLQRRKSVK